MFDDWRLIFNRQSSTQNRKSPPSALQFRAMKVYLHSIGCRLNHSEIETMARQLLAAGHEIVTDAADADKVVVNTCAVTAEAARDARTFTRRTHRQNETAEIVLTGCYATIAPNKLEQIEGAGRVVLNKNKPQLVQILDPQARIDLPVFDQEPIMREYLAGSMGAHTRAFIKAQDGCNNKCTFCITTVARGEGASRHLGDVVAEIQSFAAAGYQEAVLSGVHLGSYGHDFGNKAGLQGTGTSHSRPHRHPTTTAVIAGAVGRGSRTSLGYGKIHDCCPICTCRCNRAATTFCGAWRVAPPAPASVNW